MKFSAFDMKLISHSIISQNVFNFIEMYIAVGNSVVIWFHEKLYIVSKLVQIFATPFYFIILKVFSKLAEPNIKKKKNQHPA